MPHSVYKEHVPGCSSFAEPKYGVGILCKAIPSGMFIQWMKAPLDTLLTTYPCCEATSDLSVAILVFGRQ